MCDATAEVLSELREQHQVKQYAGLNLGQAFPTGAHCEWYHSAKCRQHRTPLIPSVCSNCNDTEPKIQLYTFICTLNVLICFSHTCRSVQQKQMRALWCLMALFQKLYPPCWNLNYSTLRGTEENRKELNIEAVLIKPVGSLICPCLQISNHIALDMPMWISKITFWPLIKSPHQEKCLKSLHKQSRSQVDQFYSLCRL